jgi:uncharacterized membrane protein YeaQ/YmgE (transglycosylase-associated protein family)
MTLLVLLTLGAALGWFGAILLRHDSMRHSVVDILAGSLGAIGAPLVAHGKVDSHALSIESLFIGALGAVAVLASTALLHRKIAR